MFTERKFQPYGMWLLPLVFFSYQFILRLWPGLMMHPIMQQFSIDASQFGLMAAFYYFGYAGMQIPIACLLERWQTRWVIFTFVMLCGVAALWFTYTNNFYIACLCRFFIGAGSAVGFLGVSKVVSSWFSEKSYSRMIGYSFSIGLLGAIYGGKPVSLLIDHYHWQNVALTSAIAASLIAVMNLLFLRSPKQQNQKVQTSPLKFTDLLQLLASPQIIMLAIANLFMVGTLEGFSDVWGVPYLVTAYGIDKATAAELISFVFFGMLFGGPLLSRLSQMAGNYMVIACSGLGMGLLFVLMLLTNHYSWPLLAIVFFCIGVLCCYQVIVFAAGSSLVKPQYLGVTVAFLNCINMLGGSFFHTLIGRLMNSNDGHYNLTTYHHALMLIPIFSCLGAMLVMVLKFQENKKITPVSKVVLN